ncbi:MAG: hypothetical protein M1351_10215 [Candidatus Thermoplasmatota archaeon]|nr:hypothetical protein [Candidatus Thermoplasmatota archaeon]
MIPDKGGKLMAETGKKGTGISSHKISKVTSALIVVIIVVAFILAGYSYSTGFFGLIKKNNSSSAAAIYAYVHFVHSSENASNSPLVLTSPAMDLSNVTVTLLSPVPDSLNHAGGVNMTGINQTDNPYEVVLLNETGSQSSISPSGYLIKGSLSPMFASVVNEWKGVLASNTEQVSLALYAWYTAVSGGKVYEYMYYNNLPFNPFSVQQTHFVLNTSIYFDMQHPTVVLNLSSNASSSVLSANPHRLPPPPPCRSYTEVLYSNTETGPLPVESAILPQSSNSAISYAISSFSGTQNFSFNSATVNTAADTTVMSTTGSWSGNFQVYQASSFVEPTGGHNVSMLYVPNAVTHIVTTRYVAATGTQYDCHWTYGPKMTSVTIADVQYVSGQNYQQIDAEFFSPNNATAASYYAQGLKSMGYTSDGSIYLPAGANYDNAAYYSYATGYTSAASAEQGAVKAASMIVAAIGVQLALIALAGAIPGAASGAAAVAGASLALSAASLTLSIMDAVSSISYSVTLSQTLQQTSFNNIIYSGGGSATTINYYQAANQGSMNVGGTTYDVNMPVPLFTITPS